MPIIITLHIFGLTVTVRIKSKAATLHSDGLNTKVYTITS